MIFDRGRCFDKGRLIYYGEAADEKFWARKWREVVSEDSYDSAKKGKLGWSMGEEVSKWLPRAGPILEAGCGSGHVVLALRTRGYEVEGVDSSPDTVILARKYLPNLPIRLGDVTSLDVPDSYYSGYISLGVMEHREEGPEPFLREAWRVLKPDGIAFISVPCIHFLRRAKALIGLYGHTRPENAHFYQYAFTEQEFRSLLQSNGFEIISRRGYDGLKGLKDEIPGLDRILRLVPWGNHLRRKLTSSRWLGDRLGHMMLFVCRKKG